MYADKVTPSMQRAIDETNRRRDRQIAYNREHGVDPQPLRKRIADILDQLAREDADTAQLLADPAGSRAGARPPVPGVSSRARAATAAAGEKGGPARADLAALIAELTEQMHVAAGGCSRGGRAHQGRDS